uniref:RING-type domain-containing protein n=1 Tax=Acrobeloides nanus TaxID=290746 RepID=A0A914CKW2_9BILA
MEELMETTADDPMAYLHPSGKYVKPIMHHKARLQRKQEKNGGSAEGTPVYEEHVQQPPPSELTCPICGQLLREAVLTICCGESFCAECIQQRLLDMGPLNKCPGNSCNSKLSADQLVPNKKMRQAVEHFINSQGSSAGAITGASKESSTEAFSMFAQSQPFHAQTQQVHRVRIGLSATSSVEPEKSSVPIGGIIQSSISTSEFPIKHDESLAKLLGVPPPHSVPIAAQVATPPMQLPSSNMFSFTQPPPAIPVLSMPPPTIPVTTLSSQLPIVPPPISTQTTSNTSTTQPEPNQLTSTTEIPGVGAPPVEMSLQPPTVTKVASTSAPVRGSASISDAWEAFLMRKDQDKKERKRPTSRSSVSSASSSSDSESSSSSSSSSASSADSAARRRRRRENERRYNRGRPYRPRDRSPARYRQREYPKYRLSPKRSERHRPASPRRPTRDYDHDRYRSPRASPQKKERTKRHSPEPSKTRRSETKHEDKKKRKLDEVEKSSRASEEKESSKLKRKRGDLAKEEKASKTIKIKIHSKDKFDEKLVKEEGLPKARNELELEDVKDEQSATDTHDNDEEEIERIIQEAKRVKRMSIDDQFNETIEDLPAENEQEEQVETKMANDNLMKFEENESVAKIGKQVQHSVDSGTEEDRDLFHNNDYAWNVTEEKSAKIQSPTEEEDDNQKEFMVELPPDLGSENEKKEKKHKKKKRRHSEKDHDDESKEKKKKKHKEEKHKKEAKEVKKGKERDERSREKEESREKEKLAKKFSSHSEDREGSEYDSKRKKEKKKKKDKDSDKPDHKESHKGSKRKDRHELPEKYSISREESSEKRETTSKNEKQERGKSSTERESRHESEKRPRHRSPEVKNYLRDESPEVKMRSKKYKL